MFWLTLLACNEYSLELPSDRNLEGEPQILVDPLELDFGQLTVGQEVSRTVSVQNVGTGLLTVEAPAPEGGEAFWTEAGAVGLAAGEVAEMSVTFTPPGPFSYADTLPLRSNDPLTPAVSVSLVGTGLGPWLEISPEEQALGTVRAACPEDASFTLQNVGSASLILEALSLDGDGQWSLLEAPSVPLSLSPGAFTTVTVRLDPSAEGDTAATISATADSGQAPVSGAVSAVVSAGTVVEDTFSSVQASPVDILFAVDQSCSMDDDAEQLAENFSAFIDTLEVGTTDWQLGVVTYDTGCFNGGTMTSSTPGLSEAFAEAVVAGEDREISDDEALLQLASRALSLSGAGDCNAGFLRKGALAHVIVVSDEPERSAEQASAWTWEHWHDEMRALASPLVVSGVIDTDGCNEGSDGYAEIIAETGGEALSICDGGWADHAAALADTSLSWLYDLPLSQDPIPETISVTAGGVSLSSGWRYDEGANTVFLDAAQEGVEVVVSYRVSEECP